MAKTSARGTEWQQISKAVIERDGGICHYCGDEATTADHVIPRSLGGSDDMDNLVAACRSCNSRKGTKVRVRQTWLSPRWFDGQVTP